MRRLMLLVLVPAWQGAACYSSGSDGLAGDVPGENLADSPDASDAVEDSPDGSSPDGADGVSDGESDDGWDRDAWYPDHLPDGVDPERVVIPLPLTDVAPCDTDGWGKACTGSFLCCRDGSTSGKCVDPNVARRHCGGCGRLCPYPAKCIAGVCVAPEGFRFCGCAWSDPLRDNDNCGRCGNACPDGASCVEGRCSAVDDAGSCAANETLCGDGCTTTGQLNTCGECGHRCISLGAGFGDRENIAGDCRTMCGQCDDPWDGSLGRWGSRVPWFLDWPGTVVDVPSSRTGCAIGQIAWLGGACLDSCPDGTTPEAWSFSLFDGVEEGTGCRPFAWSDSGAGWLFDSYPDDWPWCGGPHLPCAGSGSACIDGICTCMDGYTRCELPGGGWVCTDPLQDTRNCGECGIRCLATERCDRGACVPAA